MKAAIGTILPFLWLAAAFLAGCDDLTWRAKPAPLSVCGENEQGCDGVWTTTCQDNRWIRTFNCANLDRICDDGSCVVPPDGDESEMDAEREPDSESDIEPDADGDTPDQAELDESGDGELDAEPDTELEGEGSDLDEAGGDSEPESEAEAEPDAEGDPDALCGAEPCCEEGRWKEENAACVSGDAFPACTVEQCSASHQCVPTLIAGNCLVSGVCASDGEDNPENGCQYCDAYATPTSWRNKSKGTNCGEGATECSGQDTCDAGLCKPNHQTDGTTCGTQDQCVGGVCLDCFNDAGCADLADDGKECSEPACNTGTHVCYNDLDAHNGENCGSGPTACSGQDTCDVNGACQPNHETNGANCDDGNKCNGINTCVSGSCNQTTAPVTCTALATCTTSTGVCSCNSGYHDESGWCITDGFKRINAGTFTMGSPSGEAGHLSNEVQHSVQLTYSFEMQAKEVTQAEFTAFAGTNPSWFGPNGNGADCGDNCPVERVDWYEALAYANWLSTQKGLTPCYVLTNCTGTLGGGCGASSSSCSGGYACTVALNGVSKPQDCTGFRLPTEAEWEYAIRAGSTTAFYNGGITYTDCTVDANLNAIGWYCGNASNTTHPGGQKLANAWGLYDMSGNVYEWVWDWYQAAYESDVGTNPVGPGSGSYRVGRSGRWGGSAQFCRSASRVDNPPGGRSFEFGFRLLRSLP